MESIRSHHAASSCPKLTAKKLHCVHILSTSMRREELSFPLTAVVIGYFSQGGRAFREATVQSTFSCGSMKVMEMQIFCHGESCSSRWQHHVPGNKLARAGNTAVLQNEAKSCAEQWEVLVYGNIHSLMS